MNGAHRAIILRADSGINVPTDLKGRKVAFGDIGSTSNMLCPTQVLPDHGIDPVNDIEKIHTSRNIAHEAVKAGDVDAIGSNANSWLNVRNSEPDLPYGFFKIIAHSGALPNDMIMVGAHVLQDAAEAVRDAILDNKRGIIAGITAHEENDKYVGMYLVAIGGVKTFSDISFRLARGESVALVGANGTGKSTLLRCLMGLIPVGSGRIVVLGQDTTDLRGAGLRALRALRARIGLVSQKHNLVPRLSVLSNVLHGLLGHHPGPRHWSHGFLPHAAMTVIGIEQVSGWARTRIIGDER